MQLYDVGKRPSALVEQLLAVWEGSVRATHLFLSESDIHALLPLVRCGLQEIPCLAVMADAEGMPVAFMGVDSGKIEMLFVSPKARGKGFGRELVGYALRELNANRLDVNEDNPQGVGFYQHLGFIVTGRSEVDGQGNPFPLLHMKYPRAKS